MKNKNRLRILIAALAATAWNAVLAAPEPALVPKPGSWQIEIELHGNPRLVTIQLPGDTQVRRFWYMPYTITNNTGIDIDFYPQFDLITDTLKLYHAGVGVRKPVFDAIRQRYQAAIPLLEPEAMVTGRIRIGADNARDSVAIFEDFDPNAASVKIFIAGLSSETATVALPNTFDENNQPVEVLLRKTLALDYKIVGDEFNLDKRVMLYQDRRWIMR